MDPKDDIIRVKEEKILLSGGENSGGGAVRVTLAGAEDVNNGVLNVD